MNELYCHGCMKPLSQCRWPRTCVESNALPEILALSNALARHRAPKPPVVQTGETLSQQFDREYWANRARGSYRSACD